MTDYDPDELVTMATIADRRGIPRRTLQTRLRRGQMPDPDVRSGKFMFWRWATVEGIPVRRRAIGRPQASDG